MKNTLPTIKDYSIFLQKICNKDGISTEQARNKYGLFTYKQWENILN